MMARGRKPGQRGVDTFDRKNNRFRRMTIACGLSIREAARYLHLDTTTAEQKAAGTRGITDDEEAAFRMLYRSIVTGESITNPAVPHGARLMNVALIEMDVLRHGGEIPLEKLRIDDAKDAREEAQAEEENDPPMFSKQREEDEE